MAILKCRIEALERAYPVNQEAIAEVVIYDAETDPRGEMILQEFYKKFGNSRVAFLLPHNKRNDISLFNEWRLKPCL